MSAPLRVYFTARHKCVTKKSKQECPEMALARHEPSELSLYSRPSLPSRPAAPLVPPLSLMPGLLQKALASLSLIHFNHEIIICWINEQSLRNSSTYKPQFSIIYKIEHTSLQELRVVLKK